MQGACAQFNVSGPGFLPDENGTNLDDPQVKKVSPNVAALTIIKDCAQCPEMVRIPAGTFTMGSTTQEQSLAWPETARGVTKAPPAAPGVY
jgi:formylglycine-generating enzyme required for sulfatase activity